MLTLSAGEIPVAGDAELKRFFAAYITKNLSDSKARTANFVSEGDNASQVMQPAHDTQDNNKPGRGSFFALLIVIGAVLTFSFFCDQIRIRVLNQVKSSVFILKVFWHLASMVAFQTWLHLQVQMIPQNQWDTPSQFARMGLFLCHRLSQCMSKTNR